MTQNDIFDNPPLFLPCALGALVIFIHPLHLPNLSPSAMHTFA